MDSRVTLSDQVAIAAIIDDLHHQEVATARLLDTPKIKQEVEQNLLDYYKARGSEISQDLIKAGVDQYFDLRFRFSAPQISRLQQILSSLYIDRLTVAFYATKTLLIAAVLVCGIYGIKSQIQSFLLESQKAEVAEIFQKHDRLASKFNELKTTIENLDQRKNNLPSVSRMLDKAKNNISSIRILVQVHAPEYFDSKVTDISGWKSGYQATYQENEVSLKKLEDLVSYILNVTQSHKIHLEYLNSEKYLATKNNSRVKRDLENAESAFLEADVISPDEFNRNISNFHQTTEMAYGVAAAEVELKDVLASDVFKKMSKEDMLIIAAETNRAYAAIQNFNKDQALQVVQNIAKLATYAEASLTIRIVDRTGTRSGVERTYNASGGKSWYLVVESIDDSGTTILTPYEDSESGEKGWAKTYAIEVSQEKYKEVKEDKISDGHIDNRNIGFKKKNSLSAEYLIDNQKPNVITRW